MAVKARLLAALAAAVASAGCGTVSANTTTGLQRHIRLVPPGPLCVVASYVDSLTVSRVDAFPTNHIHFTFPPTGTTSAPEARTVARAVCGLPRFPGGMMSCPMDWGITYRLDFGASAGPGSKARHFPTVTVDATGCQQVTGAGPQRWLAVTPGFWRVLGTAMGVANPGTAFGGCRGNEPGMACPKNATYNA